MAKLEQDISLQSTDEKYICPKKFEAYEIIYPSLQCDARACGGNPSELEKTCIDCDDYITNARRRDWDEIDKPV